MFLLVEGYHREPAQSVGRIVATHAVTDTQLAGVILRLMRTGANTVVITEISDEIFAEYYQEPEKRNVQQKDEQI